MRVSELLKVRVGDIKFHDSHMSINVPKRKNKFRQGHIVNIARTSSVTCPVAVTDRFIAKANRPGEGFLVCRLIHTKASLISSSLGISYTRALEIVKEKLKTFVCTDFKLGTHSLKAGAASVVVKSGVDYNSIDKHAGWRCKESKFRYASDSLDRKLIVSKSIGL